MIILFVASTLICFDDILREDDTIESVRDYKSMIIQCVILALDLLRNLAKLLTSVKKNTTAENSN
jgi:hypothetical protein